MSERFTTLYRISENLYSIGSPVIIAAGALLKDNQTSKILAQLKFKSISDMRIKAVKIRIFSFDVTGLSVGDAVEHQYLDLNVNRNGEFGSKEAVSLPLDTTRSFRAQISNVIYSDDSIWEAANDAEWIPLTAQQKLSSVLKDAELVKQYTIETGSKGEFVPKETADLWLCSCGTINHKSEDHCVSCKKALAGLLAGLDISLLTAKKNARIEEEYAVERKAAEEHLHKQIEKKKTTKKLALVVVPVTAACIIALILVTRVFIPQSKYNKAVDFLNSGNYTGAISQFSELGNYKDSVDMLNECNYQQALFLANEAKYDNARTLFSSLGVYKDSESQILATYYTEGEEYMKIRKYSDAATYFAKAGSYNDAASKANTAQTYISYESAEKEFTEGNLNSAYEIYKKLPTDFEDVKERISLIEPYLSMCGEWEEVEETNYIYNGGRTIIYDGNGYHIHTAVTFQGSDAYLIVTETEAGPYFVGKLIGNTAQRFSQNNLCSDTYTFDGNALNYHLVIDKEDDDWCSYRKGIKKKYQLVLTT